MSPESKKREDFSEPPVPVPGKITRLIIQTHNQERVSIYVDEKYLIGVPQKAILDFQLIKGKTIDLPLYLDLCNTDQQSKLEHYFLSLLARRLYATTELFQKGTKKGYSKELIQHIINKFADKGWVNDAKFAESFTRDKYHINHWGPNKIRAALYAKMISSAYIEKAILTLLNEDIDENILEQLVLKKKVFFLREKNILKRKKKILDFLLRKGFSSDRIYNQLEHLLDLLNE